ncbi:AI-2E family transporter [Nakamurella sp. PAMC28650]|uniref:AI-2E family transporter n=1 Tax=Nakamurella sp. PAMC28650 TaxID=2762325 RepID=UPI00164EC570|nr:AI-2E family transporter [Nakamurella sp. PAMC28650]QNK81735.1 AI-2E family transporter [Nakamurella sp. PAMC28650]
MTDPLEPPGHDPLVAENRALKRALDSALEQLDQVGGEIDAHLSAQEAAEDAAAAAGDAAAVQAVIQRRRLAGLGSALSTLTGRMMAERSARAAQAAAEAAEASRRAAEQALADDDRSRRPTFHPFKIGFFGGLGLLLAYVTYLSLDTLRGTLIVIAVALLLAIGLDPAVGGLVRRGMRRGWAVTIVFLGLVAALGGAIYAIIPPIVTELATFVKTVPTLITDLLHNNTINSLNEKFGILNAIKNSNFIQTIGSGAAGSILSASVTVASIAADLLVVLILTLFFLAGFPKIKSAAYRLAPATRRTRVTELGDKIFKQMGGYLVGATIVAIQAGLVAGVFAAIVGLPYPWAIALGAAVLDFVPVIGPITVGVSMTLLGFTQSLTIGIVAAAFYLTQHLFETYWLYPRVMRRQVDISTGAVVVALLVGGALLGVTGAVLAVPVAAAVQLIVREVVMPMQERH